MFKAGLPSCLSVKELTCQCGRSGFHPRIGKTPWRRKWQPIPVFLPGKSHGQRNLVCYSPWDGKRVGHELAVTVTIYLKLGWVCGNERSNTREAGRHHWWRALKVALRIVWGKFDPGLTSKNMSFSNNVEKALTSSGVNLLQNSLMWILEMILMIPFLLIHESMNVWLRQPEKQCPEYCCVVYKT